MRNNNCGGKGRDCKMIEKTVKNKEECEKEEGKGRNKEERTVEGKVGKGRTG